MYVSLTKFGIRKKKRKKRQEIFEEKPIYINIELTGGGYYGGIDPVLKDIIHIKSDSLTFLCHLMSIVDL